MQKTKKLVGAGIACILFNLSCVSMGTAPASTASASPGSPVVELRSEQVEASPSGGRALTGSDALDSEEEKFLDLINEYRVNHGLSKLEVSETLSRAAQWLSEDMAENNYLSHTDSLGRSPKTRLNVFKYKASQTWGENVAAGNSGAAETFRQWKNSPGHNRNMLSPAYKAIGIGRAHDAGSSYRWYWSNDFAGQVD